MTFDPNTLHHGDNLTQGLKLIGEALIDGVRRLGRQGVDTPWSRLRSRISECC